MSINVDFYSKTYDKHCGTKIGNIQIIEIVGWYCYFKNNRLTPTMPIYQCKCVCGKTINKYRSVMLKGYSCGCVNKEVSRVNCGNNFRTHGLRKTPEYVAWAGMKQRCYNNNYHNFEHYGGRGIIVCDRWINSFENFLEDMGERPQGKYSLDRIDVDGNYEPSNCRWATDSEQNKNRRKFKRTKNGKK